VKRPQLSILSLSLAIALASMWGCMKSSGNGGGSGPPPPNALKGQYAFVLTGYDASVSPHYMAIAGSITADGMGHITGGSFDLNDDLTVSTNASALAGAYTIDSNFRGVISLTNTAGPGTQPLTFAYVLRADGTSGDLIELLDTNTFIVSGTLQKQDATAFSSLSALAGDFAFELDSRLLQRRSLVGRFTLNANGTSSNAIVDVSVSGTGPSAPAAASSLVFAPAGPNGSGRGTFSLTESSGVTNYTYYVISASKFVVIETDAAPPSQMVRTGVVEKQILPFTSTTVNTAASVFGVTGLDTAAGHTIDAIGVVHVTGGNAGTLHWDSNDAGTLFSNVNGPSNQMVTFDAATGRGTIAVAGGSANGLFDSAAFYLTDSGKGFVVDTTTGANNRALAGRLQPQTGGGSFGAATFSANAIGYTVAGDAPADNGVVEFRLSPGAAGAFSGLVDIRSPGSADVHGGPTAGTVSGIDAITGRATLTSSGANEILYFIGPNQFVLIDETSGSGAAPLFIFDPQ
jgi:hypothetical protein